jgi:elongation factor G
MSPGVGEEATPFEPALLEVALTLADPTARDRLLPALQNLSAQDPDLRWRLDGAGAVILGHALEALLRGAVRLLRGQGLEVGAGPVHVVYRETITRQVRVNQAGLVLAFSPGPPGSGLAIETLAHDPGATIVSHELQAAATQGLVAGYPVTDVHVLIQTAGPGVSPSEVTAAFLRLRDAGPSLLEPIMRVTITAPIERTAALVADLALRRGGEVDRVIPRGEQLCLMARAPLARLLGYEAHLAEQFVAKGDLEAHCTLELAGWRPVAGRP